MEEMKRNTFFAISTSNPLQKSKNSVTLLSVHDMVMYNLPKIIDIPKRIDNLKKLSILLGILLIPNSR